MSTAPNPGRLNQSVNRITTLAKRRIHYDWRFTEVDYTDTFQSIFREAFSVCGLVAVFNRNSEISQVLGAVSLAGLRHRGPDGHGSQYGERYYLGHTRLSIQDVSDASRQPFVSNNGRYSIIFNGEIYNFHELRKDLESMGRSFRTRSDTEVLLEGFDYWGPMIAEKLRGMFAFVIYDNDTGVVHFSRDRFGEKPLFICLDENSLYLSSDVRTMINLKGDEQKLNINEVDRFLHYGFLTGNGTLIKDVNKVSPGKWYRFDTSEWRLENDDYFWKSLNERLSKNKFTKRDSTKASRSRAGRIESQLRELVRITTRSDLPVTVALSGGIDSGALLALAKEAQIPNLMAIAVGYPGGPVNDERAEARALANSLGVKFCDSEITANAYVADFSWLVNALDEPVSDISAYAQLQLSILAKTLGFKTVITGNGADEIFHGYQWVRDVGIIDASRLIQCLRRALRVLDPHGILDTLTSKYFRRFYESRRVRLPKVLRLTALGALAVTDNRTPLEQPFMWCARSEFSSVFEIKKLIYSDRLKSLPRDNPFDLPSLDLSHVRRGPHRTGLVLLFSWLFGNINPLADKIYMSQGVEARSPYLDHKLFETLFLDPNWAAEASKGHKTVLRQALQNVLPAELLNRPKKGFTPPVGEWITGVINSYSHLLIDGHLAADDIIQREAVMSLLAKADDDWRLQQFLYRLIYLEVWVATVMKGVSPINLHVPEA